MSEDYLVHLFTTRIKAKGAIDPKISKLVIDEKRALLRVEDIDDKNLHKYLLDRLATTDKLIESQNQDKEKIRKELLEEDGRISELEKFEDEQMIRDQQMRDEIRQESEAIDKLEEMYIERRKRKAEYEDEKIRLLLLIEERVKVLKSIQTAAINPKPRTHIKNLDDTLKRLEEVESQLEELQHVNKSLLEKRNTINHRLLELRHEKDAYKQQHSELTELKENLTDLMNEYKNAFEEIQTRREEYERDIETGAKSCAESIFDNLMKERIELEGELKRAHRDKQEQKVEFDCLSKQLKEAKEELTHLEIIRKECSVPKELLVSRIKQLGLSRKKAVALMNNNKSQIKSLCEQLNGKGKKISFDSRLFENQIKNFDRLSQQLDAAWRDRCNHFDELFEEVKKHEEYKELSRRRAYLKFKLQKKKEPEQLQ